MRLVYDFLDDEYYIDVYLTREEIGKFVTKDFLDGDCELEYKKCNVAILVEGNEKAKRKRKNRDGDEGI